MPAATPFPRHIAALILATLACSFAGNHIAARIAFDHDTGLLLAMLCRSGVTLLALAALVLWRRESLRMRRQTWGWQLMLGLLIAVQSFCIYSAVARIPVALALLVVLGTILLFLFLSRFRAVRLLPEPTLLLQQKLASLFKLKPKHQTITAFLNERISIDPERLAWLKEITSAYEEAVYTDDEMALKQFSILLQRHRKNLLALNWRFKNT
mgnify:CR=1 FL=1